jgi:hypothetical protein
MQKRMEAGGVKGIASPIEVCKAAKALVHVGPVSRQSHLVQYSISGLYYRSLKYSASQNRIAQTVILIILSPGLSHTGPHGLYSKVLLAPSKEVYSGHK